MKNLLVYFFALLLAFQLSAQSEQQLADYFKNNPDADTNKDGKLTRQEARAHRQRDPSQGDNLASRSEIPGIDIPLSKAPLETVSLASPDGIDLSFAYRKPAGKGPFPTIVFFHGGGGQSNLQGLKNNLLTGAIQTRFLKEGFITVASTRRPFWKSKDETKNTGFYDAVYDAALVVEKVKSLPGVDSDKVVLYGGSGGGILAIATASKAGLACVIAGEPATVVPLDPRTGLSATPAEYNSIMENPAEKFTPERQAEMRAWMSAINCPVLVLQGNHVGLYKTNSEILLPEMKKLGKDISSISYPNVTHGFYWGTARTGATLETVEKIMADTTAFISKNTHR
jgi:dipeptidyl aminopeptidase/acylaminoacyl peptidase